MLVSPCLAIAHKSHRLPSPHRLRDNLGGQATVVIWLFFPYALLQRPALDTAFLLKASEPGHSQPEKRKESPCVLVSELLPNSKGSQWTSMTLSQRCSNLFAPAITTVMLAAGIFAPSTAYAECGNYIVYTNPNHRSSDAMPMDNHRMPGECHGPFCSQTPPPAPMPQTPPSLRILADEPVLQSSGNPASIPPTSFLRVESATGVLIRRTADIYHPPR
jgi:hypothetical protein